MENISGKQLQKLVGWTIESVDDDFGNLTGEQVARLKLTQGKLRREVAICCGQEIYLENDRHIDGPYLDFQGMLESIRDHVLETDSGRTIVAVDDVYARCIGFKCSDTGKEWFIDIKTVKEGPEALRRLADTGYKRADMAESLSKGLIPNP